MLRICAMIFLLSLLVAGAGAAVLPEINTAPGPEYADEGRMFQGIPAIERAPNGRLWAAWYGGGVTEDLHNYIILDTSGDDGQSWQRVLVLDPDGDGPQRAFDPCLWHDPSGRLWLYWAQRPDKNPADTLAITTTESGRADASWTAPRHLLEGIMMNKPTALADGRWLLPAAVWHVEDSSRVFATADGGESYERIGAAGIPEADDRNCDEHMIVERRDGSLWMLVRTRYGIGESTSEDGGRSWSPVTPTTIPHTNARFFLRRLDSGRLLLVRHAPPDAARVRSHLTAYLSDDDGQTWSGGLLLDERLGVSYPDAVQAPDGRIYLIYDYERRRDKLILMAVFREQDVLEGRTVSPDARLRVLVNQAHGVNPRVKPQE